MTKLISGRVHKVSSANVSADRYQFIELSETEPDLGLPSQLGQVFTSDLSGNRYWVRLDTANVNETSGNLYFTNTRVLNSLVGANVSLNNLIISGDLEVQGNLVTLNVVSVSIEDKNLLLANGAVNAAAANGAGITIAGANAEITYQNTEDKFDINKNVNIQGNLSIGGSIQAKDANSLLRNEINLDPNNGTYMSVRSEEINTLFTSSDWDTASWIDDGGGVAVITNAQTLYTFWDTGVGSVVNTIEVSINGGSRIPVQYNSGNAVSGNVSLDLANGQPSGVPPTSPTAITSLNFFYRTKSSINIDYYGSEILLDAQSMDIDLRTTENLDLRSGQNLNLRGLGSYPVRIYTDDTTHKWEFDNTGSLTLPKEGKLYGIGQGAASDRYGYISWDGNSSGDGSGYNTMRLVPDQLGLEDADQYIILDPTSPGHIHIRAGGTQDNSQAILYFGGENSHVKIDSGPNPPVTVKANNNSWTFGTNGTTSFPSHINAQGNVTIDGTFVGNGLVIRNIAVTDDILTGNILGQGFSSNTIVVSETLTANIISANIVTATQWNGIYTANVIESDSNLYYTNTRVLSFINKISIGDLADVANIYTYTSANTPNNIVGIQEGQALVWDGNVFIPVFVNSEVANVADLAVRVLSLEGQTTANVAEAASNLYFTNTRVLDAISLSTISPSNVYASNIVTDNITSNIWTNLYTANVIETSSNLYFTNTRAIDAVTPVLTTANVVELSSNLYFTTQRARDSVSNSTGVYYNSASGVFSIGQDVAITSDVQFRDITLSGNLFLLGNVAVVASNTLTISDPIIQLGYGNPGDQWDLGFVGHYLDGGERHTGLFRDATDKKFKFFSNLIVEPSNVNYLDTANSSFALASVVAETFEGNVIGTVSSLSNHTTSNLAEGTNLYYTNARVISAVTPLLTTANVIESDSNLYYTNARVISAVTPLLTTANVIESDSNLYYTNARVLSNVEQMSINVFADVDITGIGVNAALVWDGTKFVPGSTDTALRANFANTSGSANIAGLANVATFANVAQFANVAELSNIANLVLSISNFTTANLAEGTNLYFTNTRVLDALVNANVDVGNLNATGSLVANGLIIRGINVNDSVLTGNITITNIGAANVINANIISSQQWQGIYTANVIETSGNLYFTNTRARTAFLPGKGIAISGDGVITNTGAPFEYNTGIDGSGYANVLSTMSNVIQFTGTSSRDRFLLRSLHITNVSNVDAAISGNVLYATGNTAFFANLLPVPVGGAVELMLNTQLFQPNDIVNLQGFTSAGVATSNILQAVYTSETFSQDTTYQGTGQTLANANTNILVYDSSTSFSIIESIKVVNLIDSTVPVKIYWADANNVIKAHLAFNTPIPPNSSLETISTPKRVSSGDRIFARFENAPNNAISIFLSARLGYNYSISGIVSNVAPTGTVSASFISSETDGTLLYYTIE